MAERAFRREQFAGQLSPAAKAISQDSAASLSLPERRAEPLSKAVEAFHAAFFAVAYWQDTGATILARWKISSEQYAETNRMKQTIFFTWPEGSKEHRLRITDTDRHVAKIQTESRQKDQDTWQKGQTLFAPFVNESATNQELEQAIGALISQDEGAIKALQGPVNLLVRERQRDENDRIKRAVAEFYGGTT